MDNLEKMLFREPLTGQEFIATREDLVSSFLELSLMLKSKEDGFVTINDLIDILNKNINCDLKKVKNESDFVWYKSLVNNELIEVETINALSLDETRACERLHYISKPVSRTLFKIGGITMTVKDIYESFNDDQKDVVNVIVSIAVKDNNHKKNIEIGALKRKIKRLEKENSNKSEIKTNQDRFAEIVRTMKPEGLAEYLSNDIFVCEQNCPICDKYGYDRCPEGVTCEEAIIKWLKEEYSE